MSERVYLQPGDKVRIVAPYSEVCMSMKVAGRPIVVELIERKGGSGYRYVAQLWRDYREFSSPILTGEAGLYQDDKGIYAYPDNGPGDESPAQVAADLTAMLEDAVSGPGVKVVTSLGL